MQDQLQKAIKLAKKTGDRLIVFDPANTELTYVVMTLDDYERIVVKKSEVRGLTEDELLDKINRDIAIWKSEQDFGDDIDVGYVRAAIKEQFANANREKTLNKSQGGYFSGVTDPVREAPFSVIAEMSEEKDKEVKTEGPKNKWSIPPTRKRNAEEILDEDENTQYLEEITF